MATDLTETFLYHMAQVWSLTPEQTEVLLLKFHDQYPNSVIAKRLGISLNACVQCLGGIYKKAEIEGQSRGKANRLQSILMRKAEEFEAETSANPSDIGIGTDAGGFSSDQDPLSSASLERSSETQGQNHSSNSVLSYGPISDRKDLVQYIHEIQQSGKQLDSENSQEYIDNIIHSVVSKLPASTKAMALESRWKRVEIAQKILQDISKSFTEIDPSLNTHKELDFLITENALYRSITAFINRLTHQLGLSEFQQSQSEDFSYQVIEAVQQRVREIESPYSAWVRKVCLEELQKIATVKLGHRFLSSFREQDQLPLLNMKDHIERDLRAVDTAVLSMYVRAKNPERLNFNFFDVLVGRWMKNVPWGHESHTPRDRKFPHEDEGVTAIGLDTAAIEWAAINSLRRSYHHLDKIEKCESLNEHFLNLLSPVKERYQTKFWISPDDQHLQNLNKKYEIVSIPILSNDLEGFARKPLINDIWHYCELAAFNYLHNNNLEDLSLLLQKACQYPILDFWFNEIDHFIAHRLEELQFNANHDRVLIGVSDS